MDMVWHTANLHWRPPNTTDDTAQIREDSFKVFLPYSDSSALDMEYQMDINFH